MKIFDIRKSLTSDDSGAGSILLVYVGSSDEAAVMEVAGVVGSVHVWLNPAHEFFFSQVQKGSMTAKCAGAI